MGKARWVLDHKGKMKRVVVVSIRDGFLVNGRFVHASKVAPPYVTDVNEARVHIETKRAMRVIAGEED